MDLTAKLLDFMAKTSGQRLADTTGHYKGECVSLVKRWIAFMGWEARRGNAIDWRNNGFGRYQFIANRLWNAPRCGDIVIFQIGAYGHIGICCSANVFYVDVYNQNYPVGSGAHITKFNYLRPRVIGWLRHN